MRADPAWLGSASQPARVTSRSASQLRLVRKFSARKLQTSRSARRTPRKPKIMSQLGITSDIDDIKALLSGEPGATRIVIRKP